MNKIHFTENKENRTTGTKKNRNQDEGQLAKTTENGIENRRKNAYTQIRFRKILRV